MIGIIGGTGIAGLLKNGEEKIVKNKYGEAKVLIDENNGVVLLSRHGLNHSTPPHKINYLANMYALKQLDVKRILSLNAVGSLKVEIEPSSFLVANDFIEFTKVRKSTFYEGEDGKVAHVNMLDPFCSDLRGILKGILDKRQYGYNEGTYVCTEGPRFETIAEINMYKHWGHVVGMTAYPEVSLAKELEMCYCSLCNISNYCSGIKDSDLTVDEVLDTVKSMEAKIVNVVDDFINYKFGERTCPCKDVMKNAFI
ncbi:MTAP family purine nucleoside phosphorylase [Methanococcus voltae]|uniref:Purine nucleoside phosphorylase n=2 Tax=Methanococcus voltae TaxID=2188 RepID=A0A8J7S1T5_METVO|nr:MTAP family purine nucleoside phosphorylase [Methanococcus voltae]MBP2172775.1 5'-methylthioadenosine phosphorylase [Methanococcus voltae]MBP2201815.1 5'-methylthioadenosine phosphorylase [Methanococcus voltae]MCS3922639.1 5'-methylthioadenosine phosphorylase [Methanococcus voltae PS]